MGYEPLENTYRYIPFLLPNRFLYEFGVYTGKAMRGLVTEFAKANKPLARAVGFDSLQGLPEETPGIWRSPDWPPGAFDAREWHGAESPEGVLEAYRRFWEGLQPQPEVVVGWFKDTLNAETVDKHKLAPASYVHVDTDLYGSAVECLNFLFRYKLVEPGTLIRYDDWASTPEWTAGQSRAHLEMTRLHNIQCRRLSMNVFVIA